MQEHTLVAFGNAKDLAYLLAGESFHVAQRYHLTLRERQLIDQLPNACGNPRRRDPLRRLRNDPDAALAEWAADIDLTGSILNHGDTSMYGSTLY